MLVFVLSGVCLAELMAIVLLIRLIRASGAAERLWLERQLRMFRVKKTRPRRASRWEKVTLVLLARLVPRWRESSFAFTPRTLIRWRRQWVAILMRRRHPGGGRPRLSDEMRGLIRRIGRENVLWGAGRIMRELAKIGLLVSRNTVRRYLHEVRRPRPRGDQRWSTFVRNHADVALAIDFAVDYFPSLTGTLRRVWILVVLEIGSRRLLRLEATEHPTREWIAQQLREAVPHDHRYRYLIHDNDQLFGDIDRTIAGFGIEPLRIPPGSPQANAFAERFIGTLRRELLDRIWPLGVRHLNRLLAAYRAYYNEARPHMGIDGHVPDPPPKPRLVATDRHRIPEGAVVVAIPHLGGLHHEYRLEPLDRAA